MILKKTVYFSCFLLLSISCSQKNSLQKVKTSTVGIWKEIGPTVVPKNAGSGAALGIGRTTFVAFHPNFNGIENNTLFAGTQLGGLWKSENGGGNWQTLNTDQLPVISTVDLFINPTHPDTMYLATGDADRSIYPKVQCKGNAFSQSRGIFITTNGGETWSDSPIGKWYDKNGDLLKGYWDYPSGKVITQFKAHPAVPGQMVVSVLSGEKQDVPDGTIFTTNDGGETWHEKLFEEEGFFRSVAFKPNDPNTIYAAGRNLWVSKDRGESWENRSKKTILPGIETQIRTMVAVTPAAPENIYILTANAGLRCKTTENKSCELAVYLSTDAGQTFSDQSTFPIKYGENTVARLSFAVSPNDPNIIYYGSLDIYKSTNAGKKFEQASSWGSPYGKPNHVHADIHNLHFSPTGDLYTACDGGVYATQNEAETWQDLSEGMGIAQTNRLAVAQTNHTFILTGTQDCGTTIYDSRIDSGNPWKGIRGGDGSIAIIDPTNDSTMYYGDNFNRQFKRTDNAGKRWSKGLNKFTWEVSLNPLNPNTIYAGYDELHKSTNKGKSWETISNLNEKFKPRATQIAAFAVAPSDTNVIYVAYKGPTWGVRPANNLIYKTTDGGKTWEDITSLTDQYLKPGIWSSITALAVDPKDEDAIYVGFKGCNPDKLWRSVDGGNTWHNYGTSLPLNAEIQKILFRKGTNEIYLATYFGVYKKAGQLPTQVWKRYSNNLPNVYITDLAINYVTNRMYAATLGRGIWEVELE